MHFSPESRVVAMVAFAAAAVLLVPLVRYLMVAFATKQDPNRPSEKLTATEWQKLFTEIVYPGELPAKQNVDWINKNQQHMAKCIVSCATDMIMASGYTNPEANNAIDSRALAENNLKGSLATLMAHISVIASVYGFDLGALLADDVAAVRKRQEVVSVPEFVEKLVENLKKAGNKSVEIASPPTPGCDCDVCQEKARIIAERGKKNG